MRMSHTKNALTHYSSTFINNRWSWREGGIGKLVYFLKIDKRIILFYAKTQKGVLSSLSISTHTVACTGSIETRGAEYFSPLFPVFIKRISRKEVGAKQGAYASTKP